MEYPSEKQIDLQRELQTLAREKLVKQLTDEQRFEVATIIRQAAPPAPPAGTTRREVVVFVVLVVMSLLVSSGLLWAWGYL